MAQISDEAKDIHDGQNSTKISINEILFSFEMSLLAVKRSQDPPIPRVQISENSKSSALSVRKTEKTCQYPQRDQKLSNF